MVKGIFGIGKTLTIKREPFIKSPLAHKNKPIRKLGEAPKALSETLARTSGIFNNMTNGKDSNAHESDISEPHHPAGKKLRLIRGVVVRALRETPDTWTLYFFVSEHDKDYHAGQFISISPHQFPELSDLVKFFEYQKGKKEPIRAYSLTSAPHEKYVAITIKPETYHPHPQALPPLLSPILASDALVGREIEFTGYAGAYIMPHDLAETSNHVVHLVAGSGIVPSFSIIKDELVNQKHLETKHTLVYVNRSLPDIIFHQELLALQKRFSKRLFIKHFLSQENSNAHGPDYLYGRPTIDHIERLIEDPHKTLFFACGPAITKWQKKQAAEDGIVPKPRFMEWVHDVMDKLKVDKKRFKREIYG